MMESLEWLHLLNDLENQLALAKNASNIIFVAYVILSVCIKKTTPLVAFFLSVLLVSNEYLASSITETNMYLLVCLIYSFVFGLCNTGQRKIGCGIILLISISFAIDARLYGVNGYYGEQQSLAWENVRYIALCAHTIFVCSFISIERVRLNIRSFLNSITSLSLNNDYMLIYWYNTNKAIK